jgi:hypothetical protein
MTTSSTTASSGDRAGTPVTTAAGFVERLRELGDDLEQVPMRDIFALAKSSLEMPLPEIERLLEHPAHRVRVGAVSIMDFLARRKRTPEAVKRDLFALYLRRHDRIDNWDLVDRCAPSVIGDALADAPRDVLYRLARSEVVWERRTAIVATYAFIRRGDLDDTFAIAGLLVDDEEHLIHTAVGGWIREAGKQDPGRLLAFLDRHAATMPRIALRFAVEKLDQPTRDRYLERR